LKKGDHLAAIVTFRRGQEIYGQGQSAYYWYFVLSGVARRCVFTADGRRQIVELLLSGDFFGFTAVDEYDSVSRGLPPIRVVAWKSLRNPIRI
jgi:CRP-like cAMP-binding protein